MLRIEPAVKQTTKIIAMGTAILCVLMLSIFIIVQGRFDYTVLLGALLGGSLAVANFFLLALSVQKAAKKAPETASPVTGQEQQEASSDEDNDEETDTPTEDQLRARSSVRKTIQTSYFLRMLLMTGVCIAGILLPCFHPLATIIPLLFPRIVITVQGLVSARKEK